jgi:peptidoglycan/LPS O-acetylase OafA/YrhL
MRDYYQAIFHPVINSMGHTWSLAVEEKFYLLWPTIFVKFRNRLPLLMKLLSGFIILVWLYRAALRLSGVSGDYIYYAFDTRTDALSVGCLTAIALHSGIDMSFKSWTTGPFMLVLIGILRLIGTIRWGGIDFNAIFVYALLPVVLALFMVHAIQYANHPIYALLNNPVARYLGMISYALYLYHPIAINIFGNTPLAERVALESAACVACASGSYYIVERPFLKIKDRMARSTSTS